MTGVVHRRSAIAITFTLILAGCTASPARPDTTADSVPPGPAISGRIVVFSPAGHTVSEVTGGGAVTTIVKDAVVADVSADRKTLAYVTQGARLVLRDLADGAEQTVTIRAGETGLTPTPDCLHWSPDGRRLDFIATQDGGLYVTTPAGVATRIDVPKHAKYVQGNDKFIFASPDPGAPTFDATSQLTCGQWMDARRLVFDRVATMPDTVTVEQGKPVEVPPDTTTVATLDPARLIDSPKRWEVRDRCGTRIISRVNAGGGSTEYTEYVVDATTLRDDRLAQPGALDPGTGKLPQVLSTAFIGSSCDVLMIASCDNGGAERCATKRYNPATGAVQDLPPFDSHHALVPYINPGRVAWNPARTQYAVASDGSMYVYDIGAGASTLVRRGDFDTKTLGWLPG